MIVRNAIRHLVSQMARNPEIKNFFEENWNFDLARELGIPIFTVPAVIKPHIGHFTGDLAIDSGSPVAEDDTPSATPLIEDRPTPRGMPTTPWLTPTQRRQLQETLMKEEQDHVRAMRELRRRDN